MDQHSFEFFEDEDDDSKLDLIEIQRKIIMNILNLGLSSTETTDEDEQDIEIGGDGIRIDKRIMTFKVLILDQQA